jgi:hypothetical protein
VSALEATALLRRIMEEIDVAVQVPRACSGEPRGERLLASLMIGHTAQTRPGRGARASARTDADATRRRIGRWEVRRGTFRQGGRPMSWSCCHPTRTCARRAPGLRAGPRAQSRDQQLAGADPIAGRTLTNLLEREPRARMRRPISGAV